MRPLPAGILTWPAHLPATPATSRPIRVKNGSVDFYLASRNDVSKQKGAELFEITGGTRSKDGLDPTVAVNSAASCSAQAATADQGTLEYTKSDGNLVTLTIGTDPDRPHQKHTTVQWTEPPSLS